MIYVNQICINLLTLQGIYVKYKCINLLINNDIIFEEYYKHNWFDF